MSVVLCNSKRDAHSIFKHIYIVKKNTQPKSEKMRKLMMVFLTTIPNTENIHIPNLIQILYKIHNDLTRKSEKVKIHEFISMENIGHI